MHKVVVCVAALLLAGCSNSVSEPEEVQCADAACQAVITEGDGLGNILGVAVDDTIVPVPNATVALLGNGGNLADVTTDAQGAFTFRGLEPGFYFLEGALPGYETSQIQIEVKADVDTRAKLLLSRTPVPPQFAPTIQFDGLMGCSWYVTFGWLQLCGILGGLVGPPFEDNSYKQFTEDFDDLGMPDFVQFELTWESTQALGDGLTMMVYSKESTTRDVGASPLVRSFDNASIEAREWGEGGGAAVQVWSGASEYPVGMTFQQDFQLFVTPFFGFTPDDGWMFVRDGAASPDDPPDVG